MSLQPSIQSDTIKKQLNRILGTQVFKKSSILSEFLKYVVFESLEGRERFIKEYVIATEVLKKKPDFNPQLDAIVRIHARRLRKALESYYQNGGKHDQIVIDIPKGTYVPAIEERMIVIVDEKEVELEDLTDKCQQKKPIIAILPFKNYSQAASCEMMATVLCHELRDELTKYSELCIISDYSSNIAAEKMDGIQNIANHLGADYIFTGSCYGDSEQVKVNFELSASKSMEQIWAETYSLLNSEKNVIRSFNKIIKSITGIVAGYFGLIFRDFFERNIDTVLHDTSYLLAIYWINRYQQNYSYDAFVEAFKHLEEANKKNPDNVLLLALLGEITLNLCMVDYQNKDALLAKGLNYVNQANKLDQNNQFIYKQYAWAALLDGNIDDFIKSADICISINPNNVTMTGIMGFGYICAGEYERGLELQLEAVQLNPYYPWYFCIAFSFYYIANDNLQEALYWAYKVNRPEFHWDPLLRTAIYGLMDQTEKAELAAKELLQLMPDIKTHPKEIVGSYILDKKLINLLLKGLQASNSLQ